MVPSLLYVVASVELNGKHKIKTKTLIVKELNDKHKKKRGKHNMKPLNPSFQKKTPQRLELLTCGSLLVPVGVTNRD